MARYIDVDKVMEEINLIGGHNLCEWDTIGVKALVDRQPTADVVEVKHGEWIPVPSSDLSTGKAYKCSECEKMRYGSYMPKYCQCCGAKMDGERKDT